MTDLLEPNHRQYAAAGLDVTLNVTLPAGLHALLALMLAGWTSKELQAVENPDIAVTKSDRFSLSSPHYTSARSYSDIVSILNEVLVALAFVVRAQRTGSALVHAAAYEEGHSATVMFGARKAGKSAMTARKAAAGARIWADDLLLWEPAQQAFRGIGLSPRLRRPVLPDLLSALPTDAFIVGEYTCYIAARSIDLAPAGAILRPDRLMELQADQSERVVPLRSARLEIDSHTIP